MDDAIEQARGLFQNGEAEDAADLLAFARRVAVVAGNQDRVEAIDDAVSEMKAHLDGAGNVAFQAAFDGRDRQRASSQPRWLAIGIGAVAAIAGAVIAHLRLPASTCELQLSGAELIPILVAGLIVFVSAALGLRGVHQDIDGRRRYEFSRIWWAAVIALTVAAVSIVSVLLLYKPCD